MEAKIFIEPYKLGGGRTRRTSLNGYAAAAAKSLQSCLTLCDPIDGSPPGSTVPGILQARTLEWGAIAFSVNGYKNVKLIPEQEVNRQCPKMDKLKNK